MAMTSDLPFMLEIHNFVASCDNHIPQEYLIELRRGCRDVLRRRGGRGNSGTATLGCVGDMSLWNTNENCMDESGMDKDNDHLPYTQDVNYSDDDDNCCYHCAILVSLSLAYYRDCDTSISLKVIKENIWENKLLCAFIKLSVDNYTGKHWFI